MLALMSAGALLSRVLEIPAPLAGMIGGGGGPLDMLEDFDWPACGPVWRVAGCG